MSSNGRRNRDLRFSRWKLLQLGVDERYKLLSDYGRDGGPGLGLLSASVESPWERATTANKVPYYIKYVLNSSR